MVQANVAYVFYRETYRNPEGLDVLDKAGVMAVCYTRWEDSWR